MAQPLALEGLVETKADRDSEELRQLRRENQRMDEELRNLRNELGQAQADKETLERGIRALRQQLSPLHRALRAVFGEIELAIGEEELSNGGGARPQTGSGTDPRWEHAKQNFPGVPSQIIDALLSQRELNLTQLAGYCRRDYSTIKRAAQVLSKAGLLAKEGGKGGKIRLAE